MTSFTCDLPALALVYAGTVSRLAYLENGNKRMRILPQWIDSKAVFPGRCAGTAWPCLRCYSRR